MKSVRLDSNLQARLKQASRKAGVSESEFMRAAIDERTAATLGDRLESRLTGLIGTVRTNGGRATNAHHRYRELLKNQASRTAKPRR